MFDQFWSSTVIWSPCYKGDIECIEKVQRRFTKWLPGFRNLTYGQRLKRVSLPTLELRRLHADLVMCYRMVFGLVELSFLVFFTFNSVTVTVFYINICCFIIAVQISTAGIFWSRNLCLSVIMLLRTKFRVNQKINRPDIAEKRFSL